MSGSRSSDGASCYLNVQIEAKISFPSVKPVMDGFLAQTKIKGDWKTTCWCKPSWDDPLDSYGGFGDGGGFLFKDVYTFDCWLSTGNPCGSKYVLKGCDGSLRGSIDVTRPIFFPRTWIKLGGECDKSITAFDLINSLKWDGKEWELDGILRSCGSRLTMYDILRYEQYEEDKNRGKGNTFGKALAYGMADMVYNMRGTFLRTDCGPVPYAEHVAVARSRGGSSNR